MPLGKGRHPLWRDRKDSLSQANSSTATPCYFFTLSEERVHCGNTYFRKHGFPSALFLFLRGKNGPGLHLEAPGRQHPAEFPADPEKRGDPLQGEKERFSGLQGAVQKGR